MTDLITTAEEPDALPEVVCLCGSTRFKAEISEANRDLTLAGAVVLAPGVFAHSGDTITDEQKASLDHLHFRKIDMADRVVVVAPGGYVGESTRREMDYARSVGKPVEYWAKSLMRRVSESSGSGGESAPSLPPTVEQIEATIHAAFDACELGDPGYRIAANAVHRLYPTCQPSREAIAQWVNGPWFKSREYDAEPVIDSILSELPGRTESEVKAEALREFRTQLAERLSGEWADWFNDDDLLAWIDRLAGGEQHG